MEVGIRPRDLMGMGKGSEANQQGRVNRPSEVVGMPVESEMSLERWEWGWLDGQGERMRDMD